MEKVKFEIKWHGVTWYSKAATFIVILLTFVVAFGLGALYERVHIETLLFTQPTVIPSQR